MKGIGSSGETTKRKEKERKRTVGFGVDTSFNLVCVRASPVQYESVSDV